MVNVRRLNELVAEQGLEARTRILAVLVELAADAVDTTGVQVQVGGADEAAGLDAVTPDFEVAAFDGLGVVAPLGAALFVGQGVGVKVEGVGGDVAGVADRVCFDVEGVGFDYAAVELGQVGTGGVGQVDFGDQGFDGLSVRSGDGLGFVPEDGGFEPGDLCRAEGGAEMDAIFSAEAGGVGVELGAFTFGVVQAEEAGLPGFFQGGFANRLLFKTGVEQEGVAGVAEVLREQGVEAAGRQADQVEPAGAGEDGGALWGPGGAGEVARVGGSGQAGGQRDGLVGDGVGRGLVAGVGQAVGDGAAAEIEAVALDRAAVVLGCGVDAQRAGSLGDGAGAAEGAKEVVATTSVDVAVVAVEAGGVVVRRGGWLELID